MIYFLRAQGRVKIGFAESDVTARIKSLQTGSPVPLHLAACEPGDRHAEAALHHRFAHLRAAGEWFAEAPELTEYIDRVHQQENLSMPTTQPQPPPPFVFSGLAPEAKPPARLSSSFPGVDRVLGGGFVPGSTVLLSGDPGAGKSTLMLQIAGYVAHRGRGVIYATAEEAKEQVQLRAARVGLTRAPVALGATADLMTILSAAECELLIVDSLQAYARTPTAARAALAALIAYAHAHNTVVVCISHVNKDSMASGTNDLQHDVDVLLHLHALDDRRVLRARKNRHGPTDIEAKFRMTEQGVRE